MITYTVKQEKALNVWALVTEKQPVSHLHLAQILYLADKEHFNDFGRPIYGENYIAMAVGPVPATLKDYIEGNLHFYPVLMEKKYALTVTDKFIHSTIAPNMDVLSKSDVKALEKAMNLVLKNEDIEGQYRDVAWYQSKKQSIINWEDMIEGDVTEGQLEDLRFAAIHVVF